MAQATQQRKGKTGANAPAAPTVAADPRERALYLDLIRALAREAARADHEAERAAG